MPLGSKPECVKCGTRETPLWHSTEAGNLCNACLEEERNTDVNTNTKNEDEDKDKGGSLKPPRRSTRITRYCNSKAISHKIIPKGKGRRNLFKKTVCLCVFYLLRRKKKKKHACLSLFFSQLKRRQLQQPQLQVIMYFIKAPISK